MVAIKKFFIYFCLGIISSCGYLKSKKQKKLPLANNLVAEQLDGSTCPNSEGQWKTFWEQTFLDMRQSSYNISNSVLAAENILKCKDSLDAFPNAKTCMDNMSRFALTQRQQKRPGYTMGFQVNDRDYVAALPHPEMLDIPDDLKSDEFYARLDDDNDPFRLKAHDFIKQVNLARGSNLNKMVSFTFFSNHLSSIDDSRTSGRFFVFEPGENYDRFYQFAIREVNSVPISNSVSLVTIYKKAPGSERNFERPIAYFADLWRVRKDNKITISTRLDQTKTLENCYGCHKTALIPIVPENRRFLKSVFGEALATVNKAFNTYANATIKNISTEDFGPRLGQKIEGQRSINSIEKCSSGKIKDQESMEKVANAMNCHNCHNDIQRGSLNFNVNLKLEYGGTLIRRFVQEYKTMPPGANLNDLERAALVDCLESEYMGTGSELGEFDQWILNKKECTYEKG